MKWYTEVLGLDIGPYEEDDQFCMLMSGAGFIGLASDHPEYATAVGENRLAPSLEVDDFDRALVRLRSLGVKLDDFVDGADEGYRLTRIWDLEGNRINVFESWFELVRAVEVSLRLDEARLAHDEQLLLRLGTDSDVDLTIKASLGHYFSYASALEALGLPGAGALTLSVYLLAANQAPEDFRVGPFQRAYRTTTIGRAREAGVAVWATDVAVEGRPLPLSSSHADLVVSTRWAVLPEAYAVADKAERRRLRDVLRPEFETVLALFGPPLSFVGSQ